MDNDKLLLEKAAKSLGEYAQLLLKQGRWNPLTDDGDALRLAVKLELMVNPEDDEINVYDGGDIDIHQLIEGDPCAATRRAIVRAAAAIGESTV